MLRFARNDAKQSALAAQVASELCSPQEDSHPRKKAEGSGAPRGASNQCPRDANPCCHAPAPRARKRAADKCTQLAQLICLRGALAFRRSTCGSRRDFHIPAQLQAMLAGIGPGRHFTHPSQFQCSGSTPRLGRSTEGNDAQSRPGAECESARRRRALLRSQDRIRNASLE